ncbi:MAG: hypothetical protein ABJC04_01400 [Verrucomicrobiota bacterium]
MSLKPKQPLAPVEPGWKVMRKTIRGVHRNRALLRAVNTTVRVRKLNVPEGKTFSENYLISSDRGVFALQKGEMFQLTDVDTFGIAVCHGELFAACSNDDFSSVGKCAFSLPLLPNASLKFTEIFRTPINKKGRIHQINFYHDTLAVTLTAENSIAFLNPSSGEILSECSPFRDGFGAAIGGDHNHINSLSQCGESLLFCAYKAGTGALIGIISGKRVQGYPVKNKGAHDVYISGRTLFYSDTFGAMFGEGRSECGFLMSNNQPVDEMFFNQPPGFAIRGICQRGEEMIVGHSHKGPRSKRFAGNGALLRIVKDKVVQTLTVPFAQVYDIVGLDGQHFDAPPAFQTWDETNAFLESVLGAPIYSRTLD